MNYNPYLLSAMKMSTCMRKPLYMDLFILLYNMDFMSEKIKSE